MPGFEVRLSEIAEAAVEALHIHYRVQYEAALKSLRADPTPTNPRVTTDLGFPYSEDARALTRGEIIIIYRLRDERFVEIATVARRPDPALHL